MADHDTAYASGLTSAHVVSPSSSPEAMASVSGREGIPGMASVIASSSGYGGIQKHNLIKLINMTGALYTTVLTKQNTQLVCWEFEGAKYAFAKKHRMTVVNHRWFEDCFKEGRKLCLSAYVMNSGKEIGPLRWQPPIVPVPGSLKFHDVISENPSGQTQGCLLVPQHKDSTKFQILEGSSSRNTHEDHATHMKAHDGIYGDACESNTSVGHNVLQKRRRLIKKLSTSNDLNNTRTEPSHGSREHKDKYYDRKLKLGRIPMYFQASINSLEVTDVDMHEEPNVPENPYNSIKPEVKSGIEFISTTRKSKIHSEDSTHYSTESSDESLPTQKSPLPKAGNDVSCAICWTDSSSSRGVLLCGHRFCFKCIKKWAGEMVQKKKEPTCPLCSKPFDIITSKDHADVNDQKIYSQSIPEFSEKTVYTVYGDKGFACHLNPLQKLHCSICGSMDTEELMLKCQFCGRRAVHCFCLDPPLPPVNEQLWTCAYCAVHRRSTFNFS